MQFAATQMEEEDLVSEVSQKEDKYLMIIHTFMKYSEQPHNGL